MVGTVGAAGAAPVWRRASGWRDWPSWAGYAAGAWSLGYGLLGLWWARGGAGFPFGQGDPLAADGLSLFVGLRAETAAPVIALLGMVLAVVAAAMVGRWGWGRRVPRGVVLGAGWTVAASLILLVPDLRLLQNLAYGLMGVFDKYNWPLLNQMLCVLGGGLWAAATLAYQRRSAGRCAHCGRAAGHNGLSAGTWARLGTAAAYVAAFVPLPYATVRLAWAAGIPLGITPELLQQAQGVDLGIRKYALGSLALGGAILTIGLTRPWGETFPRWMLGLAGRRVPIWFAVVPATVVTAAVSVAGLVLVRGWLTAGLTLSLREWATGGPALLFPLWGPALGLATLAYADRRRGACRVCHRGGGASVTAAV